MVTILVGSAAAGLLLKARHVQVCDARNGGQRTEARLINTSYPFNRCAILFSQNIVANFSIPNSDAMNIESLRDYCLSKPAATEGFPFGEDTLVFKVMEKIFLLVSLSSNPLQFNAKADPEKAIELREQFAAIIPGYHMNKKHWNTVIADGSLSNVLLKEIISDSYNLVVKSLPKKDRDALAHQ
ncbi:MAG TPA: MmcQ/YjbR family DNA-binding protein [Panacibacter sp.]|nr:MmcQ/YjbR family DNA-binding protein [Panacibacter sp.]